MAKVKYGNAKLVKALDSFEKDFEKWVKKGITKTTLKIYNTATAKAPVDVGNLKSSITFEMLDGGMTGRVNVGANYAIYVEYGTGIYAKGPGGSRAKKIPWTYKDPKTGKWITTKGIRAQPYWHPAIDEGRVYFNKYFS
ncbi:TPA: HK97 gp10 family phage protein [Staphylococcus aureus]|nr:HK97 gp10 family phage protein [Staphylococcus aureus]HDY6553438.1 HK97 gp10 family phage protein [Staphylococcus aureus]